MNRLPHFKIFTSLIGLCLSVGLAVYLGIEQQWFACGLMILITFFGVAYILHLIRNSFNEIDKILLAIIQKDFSLFPKQNPTNNSLENAVALYYLAKQESHQLTTYQNLYENILNKLEIGILILERNIETQNLNVFYVNPKLLEILEAPHYNNWTYYADKIPLFYTIINDKIGKDIQEFLDISIDSGAKNTYSLRTSNLSTVNQEYCIVTLESVQSIIEKKEKLAWNNLMRVISHELMNTLTPVNSLIDNLQYITNQEKITTSDHQEMKESLEVIQSKSKQLMSFVQDYRQVAELPKPIKNKISLHQTIENVLRLMQPEFNKKGITVLTSLEESDIDADEKMIERVLINLLTNALYAFKSQQNKQVDITLKSEQNRIKLKIADNGIGIDDKIKDKIFIPFFTTRKHGSGIGLTLAKSIIEAHKGYITFKSNEDGSLFEVVLMKN
ncbi:MAG: sensor histidine kinase [Weeksellaceae bacterium]